MNSLDDLGCFLSFHGIDILLCRIKSFSEAGSLSSVTQRAGWRTMLLSTRLMAEMSCGTVPGECQWLWLILWTLQTEASAEHPVTFHFPLKNTQSTGDTDECNIKYFSICLSVCLSFYLSIDLSVCLSVCRSIYLSVYLSVVLSICLSFYLSIYLSVVLSIYLSIYLSVVLSIYSYVCRSIYSYVCRSIYSYVCLSFYLSVCLSVNL